MPVSVIVTLSPFDARFGGDVEFGVDVAAIGKGNVAARDAERVTRQVDLPAFAQRDAAVHAWLRDRADHAHVGAGGEPPVVVVDDAGLRWS